jgi:hypothetical protein
MNSSNSTVDTSPVNPIIQKARWITTKIKLQGQRVLSPAEKIFIAQLSYRASVQDDRAAQKLVKDLSIAHLEYQLTLEARK